MTVKRNNIMQKEEKELLNLFKTSENDAMKKIIDLYASPVNSICRHILRGFGDELVEDVMQETFLKLWRYISQGKKIKKGLKPFIYQIARNCAIDSLRKNTKDMTLYDFEMIEYLFKTPKSDTHIKFQKEENYNIIHKVIKNMDEPNKSIFILKYFYNYTIKEIAYKLNLKEDNVESRERRERKKLKQEFIKRGVFYE